MDTYISELRREEDPAESRAYPRVYLPGERREPRPEPPVPEHGEPTAPADAAGRQSDVRPGRRRRRTWLLGTAAVLVVAGAGFLVSPHNTMFHPDDAARIPTQGQTLASAAWAPVAGLVAPSARVARAPQPVQQQPTRGQVATSSTDDQVREIQALRDRTPAEMAATTHAASTPPPANPEITAPPSVSAPSPPPAGSPAAPAAGPRANPVTVAATRQADPRRDQSQPPLAVFETGATPALVVPPQVPRVAEAQSTSAAVPVAPPASAPAPAVSSSQASVAPALPIDPVPASASPAGPAQAGPAVALVTQPPRPAPTSRSVSSPSEVIAAAVELRAEPMTPAQQIEVLNLVTKLGTVVRDIRAENAALKSRVESTADRVDAAVADFERRLALAEARGAVNAAMGGDAQGSTGASRGNGIGGGEGGGHTAPVAEVGVVARSPRPAAATGGGVQIIPVSNAAAGGATPRYRVTAASPGLAMLSLLDRSGGEGSQLQVAVGDQVPGYGRVTAIQQRGSAWVVQTDKGPDKGVIQ